MTIDEHQRYQLHQALENQLGPENAATLMAHLPPVGWADVATKHDLNVLRSDLHALEERLELRINAEIAGVRTELADTRTQLGTEIAGLRTEMRTGTAGLRTEMAELGGRLRTELQRDLRTNMIVTITAMTAIVGAIATLTNLF